MGRKVIVPIPEDWTPERIEAFIDGILRENKLHAYYVSNDRSDEIIRMGRAMKDIFKAL